MYDYTIRAWRDVVVDFVINAYAYALLILVLRLGHLFDLILMWLVKQITECQQ